MEDPLFFDLDASQPAAAPKPEAYDYSEFKEKPKDNVLGQLAGMAQEQKADEALVARLEEELAAAKEKLKTISEVTIPKFMDDCGMKDFTTKDGLRIDIVETIRGSIPKASETQAFSWLEDHNSGRLIKREFKIEFGKDEEAWAKKFQADLAKRKRPLKATVKRAVHPQTLAAYVREQLEAGVAIPLDVFGVYRQRASKVTVK